MYYFLVLKGYLWYWGGGLFFYMSYVGVCVIKGYVFSCFDGKQGIGCIFLYYFFLSIFQGGYGVNLV